MPMHITDMFANNYAPVIL